MKRVHVFGASVLALVLGAPAISFAQAPPVGAPDGARAQRGEGRRSEGAGVRRSGGDRGSYDRMPGNRTGGGRGIFDRPGGSSGGGRVERGRSRGDRVERQPSVTPRTGGIFDRRSTERNGRERVERQPSVTPRTGGIFDRRSTDRGRYDGGTGGVRRDGDRRDDSRRDYDRRDYDRRDYDRRDYSRRDYDRRDYDRGSSYYRGGSYGRGDWLRYRARHFDSQRRSWRVRGGYRGYRIPNTYFHSHFGRNRWFRANTLQFVFTSGDPYFDYDDYRFTLLDPYPEYWGDDWYYEDDLYVDYYDDGYYLCNRRYPDRPGIAISISLRF